MFHLCLSFNGKSILQSSREVQHIRKIANFGVGKANKAANTHSKPKKKNQP